MQRQTFDTTLLQDLLPLVQPYIIEKDVPIPGWHADDRERMRFSSAVAQAMVELQLGRRVGGDGHLANVAGMLAGMMTGLGVLQPFLTEEGVEEIIVRDRFVQLERNGEVEDVGELATEEHFERVARRAADLGGRKLKGDRPYVLVNLPDGSRFTAMVPDLSRRGTAINIRRFARKGLSFGDLTGMGTFDPPSAAEMGTVDPAALVEAAAGEQIDMLPHVARLLATLAAGNLATVLVSGEFGAGKTTLLNAMSLYIPSWVQLAVVETFDELKIAHPHPLRVVVEDRPGYPSMDEVINVVVTRMRPDCLIIGEIVRDEAPRFLDAINLGKKAWSTIHGNDSLGALFRLETKALTSGLPHRAIREQIASGVDVVVHLRKNPISGRRRVVEVVTVDDALDDQGRYRLHTLYDAGAASAHQSVRAVWQHIKGTEAVQ